MKAASGLIFSNLFYTVSEKNTSYKMRLVMISGDFPPRISGVGDYAFHVVGTAAKMGADVTVITTKSVDKSLPDLYGALDVRHVMDVWQSSEAKRIFTILKDSDENTFVNIQYGCLAYGRQLMINFLPALIRLLHPKTKVTITIHGFWEQSLFFRLRALPMLRAAHSIIYVDRLNKGLMKKYSGLADSRLKFIPISGNIPPIPCTDEQKNIWREELGLSKEDIAVAFFGGIIRSKGFDYLVKAIHNIKLRHSSPLVLLAIGGFLDLENNKPYKDEVINYIKTNGLESSIRFFKKADAALVSKCLHSSDIAVYPFLNGVGENSGSMLAALAHGLPTIITSGPANDKSFTEKFGVVMVPAQDYDQLASAIQAIVTDHDVKFKMRKKALDVSSNLNWNFITGETIDFFQNV